MTTQGDEEGADSGSAEDTAPGARLLPQSEGARTHEMRALSRTRSVAEPVHPRRATTNSTTGTVSRVEAKTASRARSCRVR